MSGRAPHDGVGLLLSRRAALGHAELVPLGVGENRPGEAGHFMLGQHCRAEALEARHLGGPIVGREVQVHPVLARLRLSHSAKGEVLDTETGRSQGDELVPILADIAARGLAPERGQPPRLGAVERHVSDEEAHGLTLQERTSRPTSPGNRPTEVTERRSNVSAMNETESQW
jgi:hypothetical protein